MEELKITEILYLNPHKNVIHSFEILMNDNYDYIFLISTLCDKGELMIRVYESEDKFNYYCNKDILDVILKNINKDNNENNIIGTDFNSPSFTFEDINYQTKKSYIKDLPENIKLKLIKYIFKQILEGLNHLHNNKICHRDLKPENILFCSEDEQFKIIDFSISTIVGERKRIDEPSGSLFFQSPEIIDSNNGYDPYKNDIWSVGVLIYLFYTKELPFRGESEIEIQVKTTQDKEKYSDDFNKELKDLVERMLNKDPVERISLSEVLNHQFFKD